MLRIVTAPVDRSGLALVFKETIPDSAQLLSIMEEPLIAMIEMKSDL
jgi:hypothetical protein